MLYKAIMKASILLPLVLLLFLPVGFSFGADEQAKGPHLQISSVYGNLEDGRPSSVYVVLQNNASPLIDPVEPGFDKENARSIVAELSSSDDRIKIFSGPQNAGLLAAGENATVQFMAQAEGAALGIYPLMLRINYSWLNEVTASEDGGIVFAHEKASIELPLQTRVVIGPSIGLEELVGETAPGAQSSLDLFLANRGDEPALDLQMQARPSPPFLMVENGQEQTNIAPGERASLSLSVFTDENATPGYYALPFIVSYRNGPEAERRGEDLVAIVYVGEAGHSLWLYLGAAGLIMILLAGGFLALRRLMSGQRRLRIIKS